MPTSTARSVGSSSQSISSSPKVRVLGFPQNSPIRSARSRSGRRRTWRSSARAADGKASSLHIVSSSRARPGRHTSAREGRGRSRRRRHLDGRRGQLQLVGGSGSSDDDALVQRSCEIHFDIAADAADNADTLSETRARCKDLLDGYGVSLPRQMQQALRDVVSALTTGNANRLEAALTDFSSFC
jgi:hypothetical protein